jgi:hypothetical protein
MKVLNACRGGYCQDGLIQADRGVITIINREGLKKNCNGAYGASEAEFRRLLTR